MLTSASRGDTSPELGKGAHISPIKIDTPILVMLFLILAIFPVLLRLVAATSSTNAQRTEINPLLIRAAVSAQDGDALAPAWSKGRKRQDSVTIGNQEAGTVYTIDVEIGTPPQNVTVMVDTGSNELWVDPECDTSGETTWCEQFARFDYTESSTILDTYLQSDLSYSKGSVLIEYVTDVVAIGCTCQSPPMRISS